MTVKAINKGHYKMCQQLWKQPQINWDGRLLGCCGNSWKDFGVNVFEVGLEKALSSELFCDTKKMLLGQLEGRKDSPCINCYYKKMLENGDYLSEDEIKS